MQVCPFSSSGGNTTNGWASLLSRPCQLWASLGLGTALALQSSLWAADTVPPMVTCPPDKTIECGDSTNPVDTGMATATDDSGPIAAPTHNDDFPVEVEPGNLNGWAFSTTLTATHALANGPATPPIPTGSLCLNIGANGSSVAEARHSGYSGTLLSSLTELNYWAYRSSAPGSESVLIVLSIDTDGDTMVDDTLIFEPQYQNGSNPFLPLQGALAMNSWQKWDALKGGWYSGIHPNVASAGATNSPPGNAGVQPLSVYLASFPGAKIVNNGGGGVRLKAGNGFGGWQTFVGYADKFTIGASGTSTMYDFEFTPGFACPLVSVIARTWTATDPSGNQNSCTQVIMVEDTIAPSITCPADFGVDTDPGQCTADVSFTPTASDNCPGLTVSCVPPSGSSFPLGPTLVTCTASDTCGGTDMCTFTVTVSDNEDPVPSCPGNIVQANDAGQCGAVVSWVATATDNCPGVGITCVPSSGSFFAVGPATLVTCTAMDAAGNMAPCSFLVTVNDTEDPVPSCPGNLIQANDPGLCSAVVSWVATTTDNCPGAAIACVPPSGTSFAVGLPTLVTCTAMDAAGNPAPCSFTVTVNDTEDPVLTCPPTSVVDCAAAPPPPPATDNCDPPMNITIGHTDTIPIEIVALNLQGWALSTTDGGSPPDTATAQFVDGPAIPPLGTGSARLAVGANGNGAAQLRSTTYNGKLLSDLSELRYWTFRTMDGTGGQMPYIILNVDLNGDGISDDLLFFEPEYQSGYTGAVPPQGPDADLVWQSWNALIGGWWSLNGLAGLTPGAGVNTLAVYLALNPTAQLATEAAGAVRLVAGFGAGAWDNFDGNVDGFIIGCNGMTTVYDFELDAGGSCANTIIARTWTATDTSGNSSSCIQLIQVQDTTPPTIDCPLTPLLHPTDPGLCTAAVSFMRTATDDCGPAPTAFCTPASGSIFLLGLTLVSCTATDACGNVGNCTFNVHVQDNEPPTIGCPPDQTAECTGPAGAIVNYPAPVANDNCGAPSVVCVPPSGSLFPSGPTMVTCTATDGSLNTDDCMFTVTVDDNTPPSITCPVDITVPCVGPGGTPVIFSATATDLCDPSPAIICLPPSPYMAGTTLVTCTATDNHGNPAMCAFNINVTDSENPAIVCPPDVTLECGDSTDPLDTGSATATDNCDPLPMLSRVDTIPIEIVPLSLQGWSLQTVLGGTAQLMDGPGAPPLPTGSLRLAVGANPSAFAQALLSGYDGRKLTELTELAYWAYRSAPPLGSEEDILLLLDIDTDGNSLCDDTIVFEPEWQAAAVSLGVWQPWNALTGKWWSISNPGVANRGAGTVQPLATYIAAFPLARICGAGGLPGVRLRAGLALGTWVNFDGNVDSFCIGTNGISVCHNFENTPGDPCVPAIIRTWTATDKVGNRVSCSQRIITLDTIPPVIGAITATQNQAGMGTVDVMNCANTNFQGTVMISVPASDDCLAGAPTVILQNGVNMESATFVGGPPGTYNYTWVVSAATANGTWNATVTASDCANMTVEPFTLCVNKSQITGQVQLQSFVGASREVTFVATSGPFGSPTVLKTWTQTLSFSGGVANYTLTDVPAGITHLSAKTAWNLRKKLVASLDGDLQGVINFTAGNQLRGGDLNRDNQVQTIDYSTLSVNWFTTNPMADINGDGLVQTIDYAILSGNWFTAGDPQ